MQCNERVSHREWALPWHHNECDGISNRQPHDCLLNCLFRRRLKKTSMKLCVTGLCEGNSWVIGQFPTQRASNAENVSIWWHHYEVIFNQSTIRTQCTINFTEVCSIDNISILLQVMAWYQTGTSWYWRKVITWTNDDMVLWWHNESAKRKTRYKCLAG